MLSTWEAREDSKLGLAAEMLRGCHGIVRLKAWGTSMLPSVWPGDLLTIESATYDELVPGDIVLVLRDKRFLVHRLVEGRPGRDFVCLITKGDAIPHNDPPAAASELLGRVVRIRRANRSFVPRQRVSRFRFCLAWTMFRWERFRISRRMYMRRRCRQAEIVPDSLFAQYGLCRAGFRPFPGHLSVNDGD